MTKKQSLLLRICIPCLVSGMLLTGCGRKNGNPTTGSEVAEITENHTAESHTAETADERSAGTVTPIGTEDFIRLIFDFRNASAWENKGGKPCVVDFYADWCRPCQMMAPVMEKLAEEYQGRILFYKVNVDENRELADYFQIQGIPYFLFFPTEGEPNVKMGGMSEGDVRAKLEGILR